MPKGYWVTVYRSISDPQKLAAYAELAPPAIAPFGGRYLARGTAAVAYEAGLKQRIRDLGIPQRGESDRRARQSGLPARRRGARQRRGARPADRRGIGIAERRRRLLGKVGSTRRHIPTSFAPPHV
jgi:Domain of unknown function (DUF1330)